MDLMIILNYLKKFTNFIRFLPYGVEPPSITDDWTVIANPVLTYSKDSKEYGFLFLFAQFKF